MAVKSFGEDRLDASILVLTPARRYGRRSPATWTSVDSAAASVAAATARGVDHVDRPRELRHRRQLSPANVGIERFHALDDRRMEAVRNRMGRLDRDVREPDGGESGSILIERQGPGDAARERAALRSLGRRQPLFRDDVADAEATTGPENASDLAENRPLV